MIFHRKKRMKSLLKIVTKCIDSFSEQANVTRLAAIVGGEAVIMHGIPRTTIDIDILLFCGDEKKDIGNMGYCAVDTAG